MSDIAARTLRTALGAYDASYPPEVLGIEPNPRITGVSPASISAAGGPSTLTVTGSNFTATSVIEIDQIAQPTTYVSATSLTTSWNPSVAGPVAITVREGTGESNTWPYNVAALSAFTTEEPDDMPDDMTTGNVPPQPEPEPSEPAPEPEPDQPQPEPTGPGREVSDPLLDQPDDV